MRIMQIAAPHPDYIRIFQERNARKQTYAEVMRAYVGDYYWACHTLTPALERMGHETWLCVPEEALGQSRWCRENRIPLRLLEEDYLAVCVEQIRRFQPDILYLSSASIYNDNLLSRLTFRPRLIVGWHATHTWAGMRLSGIDLILSSHDECLQLSRQQGARHVAQFYPGFPEELSRMFSAKKHADLCFTGYWSISHIRRNALLTELARRLPRLGGLECAYHIGIHQGPMTPECPEEVRRCNRGPVWGLAMYKALASSRIVLNSYCVLNGGRTNLSPNMRQLEGIGVGSLMMTENSLNLEAFFKPDVDLVTFSDIDELSEKTLYYLAHEDERLRIAAHGQATCLRHFNMDVRAKAFMDSVEHLLDPPPLPAGTRVRLLENIVDASRDNPDIVASPDVASLLRSTLAELPRMFQGDSPDTAMALLRSIEALPLGALKNVHFCRALRHISQGENVQAERLLEQELATYPENDAARHRLSELLLRRNAAQEEAGLPGTCCAPDAPCPAL